MITGALLSLALLTAPQAAAAQEAPKPIPGQFHGRWKATGQDCLADVRRFLAVGKDSVALRALEAKCQVPARLVRTEGAAAVVALQVPKAGTDCPGDLMRLEPTGQPKGQPQLKVDWLERTATGERVSATCLYAPAPPLPPVPPPRKKKH